MSLCSVAGALVNSPTISSRMSSSVTSPQDVAVLVDDQRDAAPVALESSAAARRASCPPARNTPRAPEPAAASCSRSKSPRASACATFFMCRMPTMLSRLPWHTGRRVCGVERSASRIVSQSSLTSTYAISPRGIMMSSTLIVSRLEHLVGELRAIGGGRRLVRRHRSRAPCAHASRAEREPCGACRPAQRR